jgi:hypothetical protein
MATDKLPAQADAEEDRRARVVQKKPYRAPLLTVYGHIAKLTMTGAGSGTDSKISMMMVCI